MHSIRVNPYGCAAVAMFLLFLYVYVFSGSGPQLTGQAVSVKRLLSVSIELVQLGGVQVRSVHNQHLPLKVRNKGLTLEGAKQLVTDADRRSNDVITRALHAWLPDLQIISEEQTSEKTLNAASDQLSKTFYSTSPLLDEVENTIPHDMFVSEKDLIVWVDPLDATQEYTENLVKYVSVMVGITLRDRPIAGILHFPFENTTYWAWRGYGLSSSLQQLRAKSSSSTKNSKGFEQVHVLISRSHAGTTEKLVKKVWGKTAKIRSEAGSGYKILQVISGDADAYVHTGRISKWDVCPPLALALSLQGYVTDSEGGIISCTMDNRDSSKEKDSILTKGIFMTMSKTLHDQYMHTIKS